ncbi:ppGpp synthetase/RelA/SpoT-type nucleotidyltransferase [Flavobacterium chryseum]|uniref:RelA/SpoT domain-containing protein n=1 Tax=Flavobacterium sp. P3160 TaxID=2512113 RepID=UPI00105F717E|nr:GTP pyrophosphokinase [Flavobacterium sp. P3160]TDO72997.1 ppGpp synthetase/RelA/SpoT-type nucleotidyltransferase [Flavobacterium sp. P3160]
MEQLIKQDLFLEKYNIDINNFEATTLKWNDLKLIHQDYLKEIPKLESSAIYIFNSLMKTPNVHSVRYRIKEAEHVIEKIIRKRIRDPNQIITIENYKSELTDLIGLRALHLFKEEWNSIHEFITSTWELKEKPVANYRDGDSSDYKKEFEKLDCDVKEHKYGYRSVHYIVETKPAKETYFAEIQIRTIFEEAWSEIDHTIRYPYDQDNPVFGQFLLILNRLAGSADEMGTFIQYLKKELQTKETNFNQMMNEKDSLIKELEAKIRNLKVEDSDKQYLTDGLEKLKMPTYSSDYIKLGNAVSDAIRNISLITNLSDLSNIKNIQLPQTLITSDFSSLHKTIDSNPIFSQIQASRESLKDKKKLK